METCVSELRRLAHPELIETDIREERFVAHTLQLAIQAALDASSHIISDLRLGEPETNRQLFGLLRDELALSEELSGNLQKMAGFRSLLVHGYQSVDRRILRHVVEHNTDDLLAFAQAVRSRLLQ
ncbi:type VII toxin-antitoxin system HepT family RNase toxin [Sedimenticola hydrogenitrophicus]|uniref:type VII toxin-antitoxin system HepT family RNase toxin n=1 Tax=Sedimenticola hydrogenitrophicus TaxID=2967975 RepID=UPI003AAFE67A